MADQVFGEWALSEDEAIRFDALGLIKDPQNRPGHALTAKTRGTSRERTIARHTIRIRKSQAYYGGDDAGPKGGKKICRSVFA
jgi:hypothetical protein